MSRKGAIEWLDENFPSVEFPSAVNKLINSKDARKTTTGLLKRIKLVLDDRNMGLKFDMIGMTAILCELGRLAFNETTGGPSRLTVLMSETDPIPMVNVLCDICDGTIGSGQKTLVFYASALLSVLVLNSGGNFIFGDSREAINAATTPEQVRPILRAMADTKQRVLAALSHALETVAVGRPILYVFVIPALTEACHPTVQGSLQLADVHIVPPVLSAILNLAIDPPQLKNKLITRTIAGHSVMAVKLWVQLQHISGQLSTLPTVMDVAARMTGLDATDENYEARRVGALLAITVTAIRPDACAHKFSQKQWEATFEALDTVFSNYTTLQALALAIKQFPPISTFITQEMVTAILQPDVKAMPETRRQQFIHQHMVPRQRKLAEFLAVLVEANPSVASFAVNPKIHPKFVGNLINAARGSTPSAEVRILALQSLFAVLTTPEAATLLLRRDAETAEEYRAQAGDDAVTGDYPLVAGLVEQLGVYITHREGFDKIIQTVPQETEQSEAAQHTQAVAIQALAVISRLSGQATVQVAPDGPTVGDMLHQAGLVPILVALLARPIGPTASHMLDVVMLLEQLLASLHDPVTVATTLMDTGAFFRIINWAGLVLDDKVMPAAEIDTAARFAVATTYAISVILFVSKHVCGNTDDQRMMTQLKAAARLAERVFAEVAIDRVGFTFAAELLQLTIGCGIPISDAAAVKKACVTVHDLISKPVGEQLAMPAYLQFKVGTKIDETVERLNARIGEALKAVEAKV